MDNARRGPGRPAPAETALDPTRPTRAPRSSRCWPPRTPGHREVPRGRQIFVNRNLRMDRIEAVGFDMDYTLADLPPAAARDARLRDDPGADGRGDAATRPSSARCAYDPEFVIRGLVVDKQHGNIFKMDRHNHVGRGYHGRRPLPDDELKRLYRDEKIDLSSPRFAWIDTLFALPEACLFALGDRAAGGPGAARRLRAALRRHPRGIDKAHRDGSLKAEIRKDLARYVLRDPDLGPALHKLRSGGKKLFLLTNSLWDYTDAVMRTCSTACCPSTRAGGTTSTR